MPALRIVVEVPVDISNCDQAALGDAVREVLFGQSDLHGYDRVRDELLPALRKVGVNTEKLAQLSIPRDIVDCKAGARQVRLNRTLSARLDMLAPNDDGDRLEVEIVQAATTATDQTRLRVTIHVPAVLSSALQEQNTLASLGSSVFGACMLHPDAKAYLDTFGIDLHTIGKLEGVLPPTTRITASTEQTLRSLGINPYQFGRIELQTTGTN